MSEIILILPAIGPSANKFYAGMHPMTRTKLVHQWHTLIKIVAKEQGISRYSGKYPVDIEVECQFGKHSRSYDADNLFPTGKLSIDGLVHVRVIDGDSPKYVRSVKFIPVYTGSRKDQTIITIRGGN